MSTNQIALQGTVHPDGTLELDEKLTLPPGRVEVRIWPVFKLGSGQPGALEVLEKIWKDQDARGFKRKTREEIDAEIAADRAEEEEYEARWQQIWAQTGSPPSPEKEP